MENGMRFLRDANKILLPRQLDCAQLGLIGVKRRKKLRFPCEFSGFRPAFSPLTAKVALRHPVAGVGNL